MSSRRIRNDAKSNASSGGFSANKSPIKRQVTDHSSKNNKNSDRRRRRDTANIPGRSTLSQKGDETFKSSMMPQVPEINQQIHENMMRTQSISPKSRNSGMIAGLNQMNTPGDHRSNISMKSTARAPIGTSGTLHGTREEKDEQLRQAVDTMRSNISGKPGLINAKLVASKHKTYATEFESFDLLWHNIETKTRE